MKKATLIYVIVSLIYLASLSSTAMAVTWTVPENWTNVQGNPMVDAASNTWTAYTVMGFGGPDRWDLHVPMYWGPAENPAWQGTIPPYGGGIGLWANQAFYEQYWGELVRLGATHGWNPNQGGGCISFQSATMGTYNIQGKAICLNQYGSDSVLLFWGKFNSANQYTQLFTETIAGPLGAGKWTSDFSTIPALQSISMAAGDRLELTIYSQPGDGSSVLAQWGPAVTGSIQGRLVGFSDRLQRGPRDSYQHVLPGQVDPAFWPARCEWVILAPLRHL